MKGICFIEPLFQKTIKGIKTQTRRIAKETDKLSVVNGKPTYLSKPRYKIDEILYLKEPYNYAGGYFEHEIPTVIYKFGNPGNHKDVKWKNKLFMPEWCARYFIKITGVRAERLQDISDKDCIKEGIIYTKRAGFVPNGMAYDISEEWDCKYACPAYTPQAAYAALIDNINGKGTWKSNPYVWVYDYELIEKPI